MKTTNGRWLSDGLAAAISKTKEEKNVSNMEHSESLVRKLVLNGSKLYFFDGYMISNKCDCSVSGK